MSDREIGKEGKYFNVCVSVSMLKEREGKGQRDKDNERKLLINR